MDDFLDKEHNSYHENLNTVSKNFAPKIRTTIEPYPVQDDNGNLYIALRDTQSVSERNIYLPQDLFYLLRFFNGSTSFASIQSEYKTKFGATLTRDRLMDMISKLDEEFYIDNTRFQNKLKSIITKYRNQPFRYPVCAGSSYSSDQKDLDRDIQSWHKAASIDSEILDKIRQKYVSGLVVPHIDLRLGAKTYASAYKVFPHIQQADLYVILGIGHQGLQNMFSITRHDFYTPLGTVPVNKNLISEFVKNGGECYLEDELAHRDEHSIEFQTIFLKHHISKEFSILPILTSFSHGIFNGHANDAGLNFQKFLKILKKTLASFNGSICFVASVDFSHIGPSYGDSEAPDADFLARVEKNDQEIIRHLCRLDQNGMQKLFHQNNNTFRVCGYSALTVLLELIQANRGYFLDYGSAVMDQQNSTVTFASLLFI